MERKTHKLAQETSTGLSTCMDGEPTCRTSHSMDAGMPTRPGRPLQGQDSTNWNNGPFTAHLDHFTRLRPSPYVQLPTLSYGQGTAGTRGAPFDAFPNGPSPAAFTPVTR